MAELKLYQLFVIDTMMNTDVLENYCVYAESEDDAKKIFEKYYDERVAANPLYAQAIGHINVQSIMEVKPRRGVILHGRTDAKTNLMNEENARMNMYCDMCGYKGEVSKSDPKYLMIFDLKMKDNVPDQYISMGEYYICSKCRKDLLAFIDTKRAENNLFVVKQYTE